MFVIDTNVISELRRGKPQQSDAVRAWAAAQPDGKLFMSAITLLELPYPRILSIAAVTGSSLFHLIQSALKLPQA